MTDRQHVEIDAISGDVSECAPTGQPARYRAKLDSVNDVRREIARCYRESRSGLMQTADLSKYTYCLKEIAKVIETGDLEKRIESLENG